MLGEESGTWGREIGVLGKTYVDYVIKNVCPCPFYSNFESIVPFQYCINGSTITNCDHHKDLGVIMSNDLLGPELQLYCV